MIITKTVENGRINVELADMPDWPEGTKFKGINSMLSQDSMIRFTNWQSLKSVSIGDFYHPTDWDLTVVAPAEEIAQELSRFHAEIMTAYSVFVGKNTESVEILNKEKLLNKLATQEKLIYRDRLGHYQQLDI